MVDGLKISLITVAYFSSEAIRRLLASDLSGIDEIIVVDHSENRKEAENLEQIVQGKLIVSPNRGYGAGLNEGATYASGDVLLLSNPDIEFLPEAVHALVKAAITPGVGIAGPRFWWDQKGGWMLPHPEGTSWKRELLWRVAPQARVASYLKNQIRLWRAHEITQTEVVSGALLALRAETFFSVGGFDTRFFLYFEEDDLCSRLRRRGLKVVQSGEAEVIHHFAHGKATVLEREFQRSMKLFQKKWYPPPIRWLINRLPAPTKPIRLKTSKRLPQGAEVLASTTPLLKPAALWWPRTLPAKDPPSPAPYRFAFFRGRFLSLPGTSGSTTC